MLALCGLLAASALTACSLGRPAERPAEQTTVSAEISATAPPPRAIPATATDSGPTSPDRAPIVIASPLPTDTPAPASATAGPTLTAAPFAHVIRGGDTLGFVIQQYGYRSTDTQAMERIVALNANIADANTLPGPGSIILIPRPSPTPLPPGMELTATADAELGTYTRGGITLAAGSELIEHTVLINETMIEIAEIYETTLEILEALNPLIDFSGCDFSLPSGGEDCRPFLSEGQRVTVPGPTPLPTRRPTPSGSETATPTPSPRAPQLLAPADSARFGLDAAPTLYWLAAPLIPGETYLVVLHDAQTAREIWATTRASAFPLPAELMPAAGETRAITWTVRILQRTEQGTYAYASEFAPPRSLYWEGLAAGNEDG